MDCIGCCQRCCSCGYASGSHEEVPWLGKKLARTVQAIFLIAQFILEFVWATVEVIMNVIDLIMPIIYLFIALVLTYFLFLFFPIVIEFIVNVLMPVLLIILDIFCFVWWLLITLYRIVSLIWNIFVPFIGMIIYFIVTLIAQIFQIVFEVIGDIIEDVFMGLMQILMPIIGTLLNIIMFFIQLGLEVMMVLMDVIMAILEPIFDIIGVIAEIVGWLVGALFQAIEPILGLITEFFSWMSVGAGAMSGAGRKLLSLDDDPGARFNGARHTQSGGKEWAHYDTPMDKGVQRAVDIMNSNGGAGLYKDLLASTRDLRDRAGRMRKESGGRGVYKPDPAEIEELLEAGRGNHVGPRYHFKPITSKDVAWLANVIAGPYHPRGRVPSSSTRERRALRDAANGMPGAGTRNRGENNRNDYEDLAFSHLDMIKDNKERMARVKPKLREAWDRILDAAITTYLSHAQSHAHPKHVWKHVETVRNVTGVRGWKDVERHVMWFRDAFLVHDSYEDMLLRMSPEGTAWHEFLKRFDTHAESRKFWAHYHNTTQLPLDEMDELESGNFSTGRTLKQQQGQEFANMATTDCFSEPRNPLCLPEVNRTIGDFCPGRPCLPWNLTGEVCPGYIKTRCVWCFAHFYNAWKVVGYMLSIIRSIVMIFSVLKIIVPGISWLFKILDLLAPDQPITVQGVLCMIMHTYSVLIVLATFFYGYIFLWPYIKAIYNCVKLYRQALEDNAASDAANLAKYQDSVWLDRLLRREIQYDSLRRGDWGFSYDNMGPVPKTDAPLYTSLREEYQDLEEEERELRRDTADYDSMSQEVLMNQLKEFDPDSRNSYRNGVEDNPLSWQLMFKKRIGADVSQDQVVSHKTDGLDRALLLEMVRVRRMLRRVFNISSYDVYTRVSTNRHPELNAGNYERAERERAAEVDVDTVHMRAWRQGFLSALAS